MKNIYSCIHEKTKKNMLYLVPSGGNTDEPAENPISEEESIEEEESTEEIQQDSGSIIEDSGLDEDIVVTYECDDNRSFQVASLDSGREVQGTEIGDVDGDGYEDVLFNEQLDNKLQIYWGDGSGTYSDNERTTVNIGRSGGPGAIGDFDNDGDNDIVWGLQDSSTLQYVENLGNRTFSMNAQSESGGPRNLELIDVNADGNLDLFIYLRFGSCVTLKFGNGDGTFGPSSCVTSDRYGFDVSDINNDGLIEMFTSQNGEIYRNDLNSSGVIINQNTTGIIGGSPRFYDIDKDGDDDLFVYHEGSIIQHINDGNGNFEECILISDLERGYGDVGDLNGDFKMDYSYFTTCGYCQSVNYFAIQE